MHTWLSSGSINIERHEDETEPLNTAQPPPGGGQGASVAGDSASPVHATSSAPRHDDGAHRQQQPGAEEPLLQERSTAVGGRIPVIVPAADVTARHMNKNSKGIKKSSRNSLAENYATSRDLSSIEIDHREARCCNAKYGTALKHLLPWRPAPKDPLEMPGGSAGIISYVSLSWMSRLMYKSWKGVSKEDIWRLQDVDGCESNTERLSRAWQEEQEKADREGREPSLRAAVVSSIRTRVGVAVVLSLLYTTVMFVLTSYAIRVTLEYVNSPTHDAWRAWSIVALVAGLNLIRAFLFNAMFIVSSHTAIRAIGGLQGVLLQKVLRLQSGGEELSGQISNILTNDVERVMEAILMISFLPGLPVTSIAALTYSWYIVGPWSLLGFFAMLLFIPMLHYVTKLIGALRVEVCKVSDARVSLMTEIITNIRLIKMYSWEDSFTENIERLRAQEVTKVRGIGLLQTLNLTLSPVMSSVGLLVIMVAITLSGLPMSATSAFTLVSVLNCFQFSLGTVPYVLRNVAEALVSFKRVQTVLGRREHQYHGAGVMQSSLALHLQHATFEWSAPPTDDDKPAGAKAKGGNKKDAKKMKKCNKKKTAEDKNANGDIGTELNHVVVEGRTTSPKSPTIDHGTMHLRGVSLSVEKGKLVGICGGVGAGKSSLLSAICGDMHAVSGDIQVNGRVALVTQQAWIYNTSLRNNLLMGMPYNKERFDAMIEACALKQDLANLPDGDCSEIGEKGINLSGGQKQRVSLGRAVYSDREIYLLDDPLSAVDSRVAKHIFQQCITGCLKGKTILLVTHALHFLEQCDEVVLVKDNTILERGSHQQLVARGGAYTELVSHDKSRGTQHQQNENAPTEDSDCKDSEDLSNDAAATPLLTNKDGDGKLISQEGRERGAVSGSVYRRYIAASGGWCAMMWVVLGTVVYTAIRVFSAIWQQWWLDAGDGKMLERIANLTSSINDYDNSLPDNNETFYFYNTTSNESILSQLTMMEISDEDLRGDISEHPDLYMYQGVQTALFFGIIVIGALKGYISIYTLTKGSRRLHNSMFASVMRSPTSFFDVTPTSRIITRFSKDVDEMDYRIPTFFDMLNQSVFFMAGSSLLVVYFFPYFAIIIFVVGALFGVLGHMLDHGVKEFKRLENLQKSPVLQSASSCISGLQVIRAYGQQQMFTQQFYQLVDEHSVVLLVFRLSNRWFTFRMDLLSIVIITSITALCVFTKGTFSTAIAGLALTMVNGICQFLPFLMRIKSEFESRMTSVERVVEYAYHLTSEAPRHVAGVIPDGQRWPSQGAVVLKQVCLRYRANLPLVLRNISADISGGEKIGVVGRTGAGKSSLISALLRVVELDSGSIEIDGVDIMKLGLHTLRSAVSVIPQDPVLFQGTIKYNLDPFSEHSDSELQRAAERSRLWPVVTRHPLGLRAPVEATGQNFSLGERQLICLTRAVLRNSKVLLLDEATASVDPETDQLIQAALQSAFGDATLFTVAHRLNTIAHYDRIMVLDDGQLREFGTPKELLETPDSLFRQMLSAIGVTTVAQLDKLS